MKNLIKFLLIGFVTASLLHGCTSKGIKEAKEFMDASMYEQAISLLENEIHDNPKSAEANYLLGKCYLQSSSHTKVEDYFNRAILLDTDFKDDIGIIYFGESLDLFKENNLNYANFYYEKGLKFHPMYRAEFAKQLFKYAGDYAEISTETAKSIRLFSIVDEISPDFKSKIATKTYELARSFIDKGFIMEGFAYADFGIYYDSRHIKDVADLYFNHAYNLLTFLNKPKESIKYFDRCMKLNPARKIEIGNIYYDKAKDYENQKEINLLLVFAKKSVEINSDYNSWYLELKEKYKLEISQSGIVAYYPFNGNANDVSGNGNHAEVHGASLTSDRFGNTNSAFMFDGDKDHITTNYQIPDNTSWSIVFWFALTSEPTYRTWISILESNKGLGFRTEKNKDVDVLFGVKTGNNSKGLDYTTVSIQNLSIDDGDWHMWSVTYDDITKYWYIYLDGKLTPTASIKQDYNATISATLRFGRAITDWYDGKMDDIRIYERVLSDFELRNLFNE